MKRLTTVSFVITAATFFLSGCAPSMNPAAKAISEHNTVSLKKELDSGISPHYVIPNSELYQGNSLMDLAVLFSSYEAIDLLAERGADVQKSVKHFNITYQPLEVTTQTVNTLLKHQVDPTLLLGNACGQSSVIKLLLDKGAKADGKEGMLPPISSCITLYTTYDGYTKTIPQYAQTYAPIRDHALESTYLLIQNGANVNASKTKGSATPLDLAVVSGNLTLVDKIIQKGGDVNRADSNGITPLMHASSRNFGEIVKLLLAKGANPLPKDNSGKTAADWALKSNYTSTYNLIANAKPSINPSASVSKEPSQELQAILKSKNQAQLRNHLDQHPEDIQAIKDPTLQLLYTGPKELRITDIVELTKLKKKDAIIIAQINAIGGPYKSMTLKEMNQLEKMGLSDEVVAAMITVTTQYQQKHLAQVQEQPKQQPIQQQPIVQQPIQQTVQQPESTIGNAIADQVTKEVGSRLIRQFLPF